MNHQRQLFTLSMATAALAGLLLMFGCSNSTGSSSTSGTEPTAVWAPPAAPSLPR